ncbi:hypothetical protein QZH41_000853 [Actinostola sp. cb2023]|nr:hypothetical protein QZH41_000853 [Actinostola sp. cb2023]
MSSSKILISTLDVKNYRPEEISLRVEDKKIYVDGKHHAESKHGTESFEFHRVFQLPPDVEPSSVSSRMTYDGLLHIEAFKTLPQKQNFDVALLGCSPGDVSTTDEKKFAVSLDVKSYLPRDVQVKVKGNELSVHAVREKKEGGVSSVSEFQRHFLLPKDVDMDSVVSRIDKNGQLHIEAKRKGQAALTTERQIHVLQD